jgi:hypothetical protein
MAHVYDKSLTVDSMRRATTAVNDSDKHIDVYCVVLSSDQDAHRLEKFQL